jgi:zinc protease
MTTAQRAVSILAGLLLLAAQATAALAQAKVSEHRSPSGIPFRHVAIPGDVTHALSFAWPEDYTKAPAGKEGVVALAPRLMLDGGSRSMTESERIELLKDLQATLSLAGGAHYTRGGLTAPKARFAEAAGLLADLLANPALPADKLLLIKRNITVTSRQALTSPETTAARLFVRLALGDGALQRILSIDPVAYEKVEIADIDAWRRTVLGRDRVTIASAGPLTPEEVGQQIDRIFAGLPNVGQDIGPRPPLRTIGKLIVLERPTAQTAIIAGGPSTWVSEPDTLPGSVAVRALGSGFGSRLTKAVREGLGATYGIRAGFQQVHPKAFTMVISTAVDSTKAAAALAAIRKEYATFRADGVTDAEVTPIKTKLISEAQEQMRRSPSVAQRLRELTLAGFPIDYLTTYEAQVQALTVATVNEGIRTRFPTEPLTVVMVAPSAEGLGADCVIKAPEEISRCE